MRLAVQHARGAHDAFRQFVGARDRGQFVVDYAGEREQVVALVLQRDAYRADATGIDRLAPGKLGDDEIKNFLANVQARAGQRQDVVGEPGGERSDVASQSVRTSFGLQGERDPVGKVRITLAFPVLACSFLGCDLAPLAMPARVLARASH